MEQQLGITLNMSALMAAIWTNNMARENLLKLRRGTAAQWNSANPVLNEGEPGFESDTKKFKIGDGTTIWNDLDYVTLDAGDLDDPVSPYAGLFNNSKNKIDWLDTN
jgi:hypothetical protein